MPVDAHGLHTFLENENLVRANLQAMILFPNICGGFAEASGENLRDLAYSKNLPLLRDRGNNNCTPNFF